MRRVIIPVILTVSAFAADKPKPPVLTPEQQVAIYQALYESESLAQAREAITKADKNLQAVLQSCGEGFSVARDEGKKLICVVNEPVKSAAVTPPATPPPAPKK